MARELQGLSTEIRAAMVAGLSAEQQEMMQGGLRTMIGNLEGMYLAAAQVSTRDKAPVP
jgi:hypothetical protein